MRLKPFAAIFLCAHAAFAMFPAKEQDAHMPVVSMNVGEERSVAVGAEGVRIIVQLGYLEEGVYELSAEGFDDALQIEPNRFFPDQDNRKLLGFYVDKNVGEGHNRYARVTQAGFYEFTEIVRSQENFLSVYNRENFDSSKCTNFGSAIDAAEFENFPDCPFVHKMPKAGINQDVIYRVNKRDDLHLPDTLSQKIASMMRFH